MNKSQFIQFVQDTVTNEYREGDVEESFNELLTPGTTVKMHFLWSWVGAICCWRSGRSSTGGGAVVLLNGVVARSSGFPHVRCLLFLLWGWNLSA